MYKYIEVQTIGFYRILMYKICSLNYQAKIPLYNLKINPNKLIPPKYTIYILSESCNHKVKRDGRTNRRTNKQKNYMLPYYRIWGIQNKVHYIHLKIIDKSHTSNRYDFSI